MRRPFLVATVALVSLIGGLGAPAGAVVGGQEADPGEWPWQMAILVDGALWCGGSLLAADLVLTAAHCTDGLGPSDLEVVGGTIDLRAGDGQRRAVVAIDQHEGFDEGGLSNDISLITLEAPFELGDAIGIVEVAGADESAARTEQGDPAVVTGFGATGEDEAASDVLLEAELETMADDRCVGLYRQDGDVVIGRSQVCAGRDRGHVDACYGDSGGPLVVPADTERSAWRLIGIVSWGAGCGAPLRPTVYTEVAAFAEWLAQRGVGPEAGERHEGDGARLPAFGTRGKASRYPLTLTVSGFDGPLEAVSVRLLGLSHERPEDLDVWLVAPDASVVTLLSDVGGVADLESASILVVDGARMAARAALGSQLGPTDREADDQRKGASPPADLSVLRGIDPNGTWQLLVADDHPGARGSLDAWSLQLT
jgi:trypsin